MKISIALLAGCALALPAMAQTNGLQNGGFENLCLFCGGPFPDGWSSPGGNTNANRRTVGDGQMPALFPVGTPNALTPHSGNAVAEIRTPGTGGFIGLTTDNVNFCYCDQTCGTLCSTPYPYFDPVFDYNGGDVVVTAWYMIPADQPIVGDASGIKINIKVQNQDVATMDPWALGTAISGTTNGQWMPYTVVFTRADIQQQYECNRGIQPGCGCNCVPAAPLPNHCKLTLGRFVGDGSPTSGIIYWDDITYTQLPPAAACEPDVNQDGVADQGDVDYLINVIAGGENPTGINPDFNNDGVADQGDIDALVNVIAGGPCP
ncbi:MAG: hypothetical protein GC200_00555 [Tepidisphaera sp.]|nr:hypothetical protein [Tepidisphaera sp.]